MSLEQYATEGDLAAYWMLGIDQLDDVSGKHILDLGAGNGVLGLGLVILGASRATFVEADEEVCGILEENCARLAKKFDFEYEIINAKIGSQNLDIPQCDIVVSNPPWGVQQAKADRPILELAFSLNCQAVHILHSAQATHMLGLAKEMGWNNEAIIKTEFRLPPTYTHHKKGKASADVMCWRFYRGDDAKLPPDEE